MSVTIKDVAGRAGVSPSTVSRVLNQTDNVDQKTRRKVLKAIEELGYQPSEIARGLRIQKSKTIGLIVPDILNQFFAQLAKSVEDVARKIGYTVMLCNINEDPEREKEYLNLMLKKRVDGVILVPLNENVELIEKMKRNGIPIIFADREIENYANACIQLDNVKGAKELVRHLVSLGHKKIGYLGGPLELSIGRNRLEGYKQGLAEAGIPFNEEDIRIGNFEKHTGYFFGKELLSKKQPPTAFISANNEIAFGLMMAIRELGIRTPDDIAVVTFDDPEWAQYPPSLTVLKQPIELIAEMSVDYLIRNRDNQVNVRLFVDGQLIVRESTGTLANQSI